MRCMQRESRSIGGSTSPVEHLRTHLPSPYVTDTLGTYLSRRNMAFSPSTRFLHHKCYCSRTRVDKPPIEHHIVIKHTATCVSAQVLWKSGQAVLHSDALRSMPARVVGQGRACVPPMCYKQFLQDSNHLCCNHHCAQFCAGFEKEHTHRDKAKKSLQQDRWRG